MSGLRSVPPMIFVLTRDREKARVFYRDVLGLAQTGEDDFAVSFDVGGVTLRLTTVPDWQPHPHTVFGWHVADVAATARELVAKGVAFAIYPGFGQDELGVWSAPGGAQKVAWFSDPDGNVLSLAQG